MEQSEKTGKSKRDDGGMAFPGFEYMEGHGANRRSAEGEWETFSTGMTLRDYFAAAALTGLMSRDLSNLKDDIEVFCFRRADAMIAERNK